MSVIKLNPANGRDDPRGEHSIGTRCLNTNSSSMRRARTHDL